MLLKESPRIEKLIKKQKESVFPNTDGQKGTADDYLILLSVYSLLFVQCL